jgi:putative solute:sodium symporter small subunit
MRHRPSLTKLSAGRACTKHDTEGVSAAAASRQDAHSKRAAASQASVNNAKPISRGRDITVTPEKRSAYWKANIRLVTILLVIWFVVSYGLGILLVEPLNTIHLGGYPLGFWFAQQGSIYIFMVLIFVYAAGMNTLDKKFDVDEQ